MEWILGAGLLASFFANAVLTLRLINRQAALVETRLAAARDLAALKAQSRTLTQTAEELLHDLTRGQAVVRVERIAPSDILLRSPRT